MSGLIGDDWANTGSVGFLPRYDALMAPVADEEAKGPEGPNTAHLALARFLVGSQLSFETIGVLNDALRTHPVVIIGGVLQENPFFIPPDQFLLEIKDRRPLRRSASTTN